MNIVDKRRDYYDSIYGEPEPVWVRQEHTYLLGEDGPIPKHISDMMCDAWRDLPMVKQGGRRLMMPEDHDKINKAIVGFCGEYYPVLYYNTYLGRPKDIISASKPSSFVKKFNNTLDSRDKKSRIKLSDHTKKRFLRGFPFNDWGFNSWMSEYQNMNKELFQLLQTPVFVVEYTKRRMHLTINPILINYGFQRVIGPWDAYQKIDIYLGNELASRPLDDFKMTDTLKRDSKGMDEWSFKQKGPKKRKA